MFTIKYIYPTGQESITGPYEMVTSEWVNAAGNHNDPDRSKTPEPSYRVVYAYASNGGRDSDKPAGFGATMTYGPNVPYQPTPEEIAEYEKQCNLAGQNPETCPMPAPLFPPSDARARVFVMNEAGATVAKYEL